MHFFLFLLHLNFTKKKIFISLKIEIFHHLFEIKLPFNCGLNKKILIFYFLYKFNFNIFFNLTIRNWNTSHLIYLLISLNPFSSFWIWMLQFDVFFLIFKIKLYFFSFNCNSLKKSLNILIIFFRCQNGKW